MIINLAFSLEISGRTKMYDINGIKRGFCRECGEDECSEFGYIEKLMTCGYCGCFPIKHVKIAEEDMVFSESGTPRCSRPPSTIARARPNVSGNESFITEEHENNVVVS